jgi:hypothetical protein
MALSVRFGINQMVSWRARHIQVLPSAGWECERWKGRTRLGRRMSDLVWQLLV